MHVYNIQPGSASQHTNYPERGRQEVTMNSLLAAVLDFANQDLLKERMKNNIPEMH